MKSSSSSKNFDFDLGIGGRTPSRPLRDQKTPNPSSTSSSWTYQPSTAAAPPPSRSGISNPSSMAGDIFGKSWAASGGGNVVRNSDPNLFGDLLGSALNGKKSIPMSSNSSSLGDFRARASGDNNLGGNYSNSSNLGVNLGGNYKNSSSNLGDFRARASGANLGGNYSNNSSNLGDFRARASGTNLGGNYSINSSNYSSNLSNFSINSSNVSSNVGVGIGKSIGKGDPFGSLVDFASKSSQKPISAKSGGSDSHFGGFQHQNPTKATGLDSNFGAFGSNSSHKPIPAQSSSFQHSNSAKMPTFDPKFGDFESKSSQKPISSQSSSFQHSNSIKTPTFDSNFGDFGAKPLQKPIPAQTSGFQHSDSSKTPTFDSNFGDFGLKPSQKPIPTNSSGFQHSNPANSTTFDPDLGDFGMNSSQKPTPESNFGGSGTNSTHDPLDDLFTSTISSGDSGKQGVETTNNLDFGDEFGGHDLGGTTTELEGLPPPPAGVSAATATAKGSESYKQGQFADGIKWLSWAVQLLEKSGDSSSMVEVLICRASCYKEVGEIKKAIADCSKVLENDEKNVGVLVQRALLYESSEKYKLGADDLRAVLKLDPMNRVARSTVHRLTQMAG